VSERRTGPGGEPHIVTSWRRRGTPDWKDSNLARGRRARGGFAGGGEGASSAIDGEIRSSPDLGRRDATPPSDCAGSMSLAWAVLSSREKREGVRRGKRPQSVMRQGGEFVGSAPNSKAMQWGSHVPGIASVRAELQQKIRWERNPETLSFSGQHRIRGGKRMPRPLRIVLRSRSMLT
jgi:hypothetical protein